MRNNRYDFRKYPDRIIVDRFLNILFTRTSVINKLEKQLIFIRNQALLLAGLTMQCIDGTGEGAPGKVHCHHGGRKDMKKIKLAIVSIAALMIVLAGWYLLFPGGVIRAGQVMGRCSFFSKSTRLIWKLLL